MGKRVKYASGTAASFISRTAAIKKLQLTLKDFQRLCILKGIYPRDPANKKKANKGSSASKIFYHVRDINYLAHEPIIHKFREQKTYMKKLTTAIHKLEKGKAEGLRENKPVFNLDHLVRERYPTFTLALRDLDDCLNLLFAFAMLPKSKSVDPTVVDDCRRLTAEFLHYVIHAQCLTKVFISIKGTYYQARIMGEKVTWIVGHQRSVGHVHNVDFAILANFVNFYITSLGFINFRLFKNIGLIYPPKLSRTQNLESNDEADEIYSLAHEIQASADNQTVEMFNDFDDTEEDGVKKAQQMQQLRVLFKGCKFFLNREVPTEMLALVIRNCGGIVAWSGCPNAKYDENFDGITHHVIDRPLHDFSMNRIYIQPQWVFDSFNHCKQLPVGPYVPGAKLPPHLSPFVVESDGDYMPPERLDMLRNLGADIPKPKEKVMAKPAEKVKKPKRPKKTVVVRESSVHSESKQKLIDAVTQNKKLREMMIPKRYKMAYKKMQFGIKRKAKEVRALEEKRRKHEEATVA